MLFDERERQRQETKSLCSCEFRTLFGQTLFLKWGHFLEKQMSDMVAEYRFGVEQPSGDHSLEKHEETIYGLTFSDDHRWLFTGSVDGMIIAWDLSDYHPIHSWVAHRDSAVNCLGYGGCMLFSGGKDQTICAWDGCNLELLRKMEGHTDSVFRIDVNSEGTLLVSGSRDSTVRLWSVPTGECIMVFKGHSRASISPQFVGSYVVSGSWDKSIRVWNPENGQCERNVFEGIATSITDVCINCDESRLACVCMSSAVFLFDWPELNLIRSIETRSLEGSFHPFLPYILACDDRANKLIHIWDVRSGLCIHTLMGHSEMITFVQFSRDGQKLITLSEDKMVKLWDVSFLGQDS